MELALAPGIVGEADYWPGEAGMPAVLIVHGFLQTREFPTVRRLAEALADQGYSVLTPTLTLGLNRRRQSLACEAIHTHSMQRDVAELRAWALWLAQRTGKSPVLIGHSTGGLQLAVLRDAHPEMAISKVLIISPSYFGEEQGPRGVAALRARAIEHSSHDDQEVHGYTLGYCTKYVTTAEGLVSYLDWDRDRLRAALVQGVVPVAIIYGDEDERIDTTWLDGIAGGTTRVHPVRGANHFFDLAHESDLLGEVVKVISGGGHG